MIVPAQHDFRKPDDIFKVAAVSGSWKAPSKTRVLTDAVVSALQARKEIEFTRVDLAEIGKEVAGLTAVSEADQNLSSLFSAVTNADLLIVGSPIYKGGYTGLFKHFFDLIDPLDLVGTPVILTATGGSLHYALALEHQFRPLFSFFRAHTLSTAVYAVESDFESGALASESVKNRINITASEALLAMSRRRHERELSHALNS
jgi:FMN reductase